MWPEIETKLSNRDYVTYVFKNMFVSIKYLNKSQCRDGVSNRGPVGCESGDLPTRLCMYVSLSL